MQTRCYRRYNCVDTNSAVVAVHGGTILYTMLLQHNRVLYYDLPVGIHAK
jgi:hypothetical protein